MCHRRVQHGLGKQLQEGAVGGPSGFGRRAGASGGLDWGSLPTAGVVTRVLSLRRTRGQARRGPAPFIRSLRFRRAMTVRDRVGRTRYVAFRIVEGGPLHRQVLSGALPASAKLTRFDGTYGIVRTLHRDRDALVSVLNELRRLGSREVRIETLATSGTIRRAAEALPRDSEASRRTRPPRK